jgi:hypothetical protein
MMMMQQQDVQRHYYYCSSKWGISRGIVPNKIAFEWLELHLSCWWRHGIVCLHACWQSDDKQVSSTQACNSTISENSSRNKERETRTLWLLAAGIDLLLSVAPLWTTKHTSHNKRTTIWAISRLWYIHASQRRWKLGDSYFQDPPWSFLGGPKVIMASHAWTRWFPTPLMSRHHSH